VLDLSFLRCVPNLVVMAPSDENDLRRMLRTSLTHPGPCAIRFPRGAGEGVPLDATPEPLPIGKGRVVRAGGPHPEVLLVAVGTKLKPALAAAEELAKEGIAVEVIDPRFVKPLDEELICAAAARIGRVVTVEENALQGGFGSACLEAFESAGLLAAGLQTRRLGIPDRFIEHADQSRQRAECGIDAPSIVRACRELAKVKRVLGAA
jgi:1-deoxy-D-xylulose-5-phosphate synthase